MATIIFNPLVDDARKKFGRVVLSRWKKTNYFRKYTKLDIDPSQKQIAIRDAFSALVAIWKCFVGIMQGSWDRFAKNLNMTGFNAFIGKNSARLRNNEALELFRETGEAALVSLTAIPGASGSIVCTFAMPADSALKHVVFFSQKLESGKEGRKFVMHEAGVNPASPFTITGLEPGGAYFIYAVVADNAYGQAQKVSAALSASATAGA